MTSMECTRIVGRFVARHFLGGFFHGIVAAQIDEKAEGLFYFEVVHVMFIWCVILMRVRERGSEFKMGIETIRIKLFELFV